MLKNYLQIGNAPNGHCKTSGYKLETNIDLKTGIPLSKELIGINEEEAKYFISGHEESQPVPAPPFQNGGMLGR